MLKIGITGGIGSGKTTVCQIFETLGIPVYYADDQAKWLMTHDALLVQKIKQLFGSKAYLPDGQLNRPFIAGIVFKNRAKLEKLNHLVHPAVHRHSLEWHARQENVPYTLKEAALLFESRGNEFLDKIITVTAPEELRIQRVMQRDQVTAEAVKARMDKQWPDAKKVELADFVIYNESKQSLIAQVWEIHQQIIRL